MLEKFQADIRVGANAVIIIFQGISIRNYTYHKMLMNEIRLLNARCIACEYEGRIVILADTADMECIIRRISDRVASSSLALGISMPFYDLNKTALALKQALLALNASSEPGIRYCKDLALPYLLRTLRQNEMSVHLLHPALDILKRYDRENDSELFYTMYVYVQTGCNQTDTANTLHVHLNTLKYRLTRIRELTKVDFKDRENLLYIWLSLELKDDTI